MSSNKFSPNPEENAIRERKKRAKRGSHFFAFKRKYLMIPYAVFLALFIIVPIAIILVYAFAKTNENGAIVGFSAEAFLSFFTSTTKLNVLTVSLFVGILNTIICLLIGYPLSYFLANRKYNTNAVLVMLFVMPMWINFVLRTGATRDVLTFLGINGGNHAYLATMIGMVYNYLPFTILPLYTTMIKLDKAQLEAAADLGANPVGVFFRSVLPQSVPGIVSAAEMVFMPTLSSYVISDTLSEGKITLFGNIIYLHFSQSQWDKGSFMALVMLILVAITMVVSHKFGKEDARTENALW
ncbi:MAG: ABC transporter permease [Bacilli bacterium]|nr:ABC transporter permease [Bacilli bacterium]